MRRQRVQRVLVGVGLGATIVAVVFLGVQFFMPETPITQRVVDLGEASQFERGSVTTFRVEEGADGPARVSERSLTCQPSVRGVVVHLVRLDDGSFRALSATGTHLRELIQWDPDAPAHQYVRQSSAVGLFVEPCHSEVFAIDGTRLFGPAPRDLDRYEVRVEDGRVLVDLGELTEGARLPEPRGDDTRTPVATTTATRGP